VAEVSAQGNPIHDGWSRLPAEVDREQWTLRFG
jgi:hypothetical protein